MPIKRSGRLISVPFGVVEYKKEFFIGFHGLGRLHIKKGKNKIEKEYKTIFEETLRFISLARKTKILQKIIPYDIRTGKILGKHILEKLMPKKDKEKILLDYQEHIKKELNVAQISLSDYLDTAAVCYKAAYTKDAKNISPLEMYKKWADGRDGGMLSINDKNSKEQFTEWQRSGKWAGSHPFEIVFSWHRHGIHLYPPHSSASCYSLHVTNYAYAWEFIEMVKFLIKKEIPFQARELNDVLNYLAGEAYFIVNDYDEHFFHYIPSKEHKKLYFKHIHWDDITVPEWKDAM